MLTTWRIVRYLACCTGSVVPGMLYGQCGTWPCCVERYLALLRREVPGITWCSEVPGMVGRQYPGIEGRQYPGMVRRRYTTRVG